MKLYLYYKESTHGGEVCQGDEDSEWPNYEPEYTEVNFTKLCINSKSNWEVDEVEGPDVQVGDIVHLVIVRYSTGNTFGRSYGRWTLVEIFKDEDFDKIESLEDKIRKQYSLYRNNRKEWDGEYRPWIGYFEALEDIEVHTMRVYRGDLNEKA